MESPLSTQQRKDVIPSSPAAEEYLRILWDVEMKNTDEHEWQTTLDSLWNQLSPEDIRIIEDRNEAFLEMLYPEQP